MLWGELTYIIMRNKYLLFIYKYVYVSKTSRQIYLYKSVCPIYVHDTGEYVGSAFLICDINYVCHFPKVEGKARETHRHLSFFSCDVWCAETQGLLHEHGCAGVQESASERIPLLVDSQRNKPGSTVHMLKSTSAFHVRFKGGLVECTFAGRTKRAWGNSPSGKLAALDTISQSWNVPVFLTLVVSHCRGW